tara:strand:- start:1199 stop:1513 length:315 start_codon:yes stop_codon:yes gene_type:complete
MPHLENWSVGINNNGYQPPELNYSFLVGRVYNHSVKEDGKVIETSWISKINRETETVKTYSGSEYTLGTPDPEWVEWLRARGMENDNVFSYFFKNNASKLDSKS